MKIHKTSVVLMNAAVRVLDNPALAKAIETSETAIPVFVFTDREFQGYTKFGFPKTNYYRLKFLLESLEQLQKALEKLHLPLVFLYGDFVNCFVKLQKEISFTAFFWNEILGEEERIEIEKLLTFFDSLEIQYSSFESNSLFETKDLPFEIYKLPDVFTEFRKKIEASLLPKKPIPTPNPISSKDKLEIPQNPIPKASDFSHASNFFTETSKHAQVFPGGEENALLRLEEYFWKTKSVLEYKETRNGMIAKNDSTKFSPYLANGCISPRTIYWELQKFESQHGANESTYWVYFELLWREYFRLFYKKYKSKIFQAKGTSKKTKTQKLDLEIFDSWRFGKTKEPFVNACMNELRLSGFLSNRGRQNVASYLVHDLEQDWRSGASWFESMLVDFDVTSNYGNWCYVAGVGADPRNRKFNIQKQQNDYDPKGDYTNLWLN